MKKIISLVIVITVVLSMFSVALVNVSASDLSYEGFTYMLNESNEAIITGYAGEDTVIEIPAIIGDYQVTSIGKEAFYHYDFLTGVTIPSSVTSIGAEAFAYCDNIEKVNYTGTIDEWVSIEFSDIGSNPLEYCGCLYIDNELVTDAKITTATKINDFAFRSCTALESVTIPISVTTIGSNAFARCNNLKDTYYKGTIDQWADIEFHGNPLSYSECLYINDELVTDVVFTTATKINPSAFSGYIALESVTIPQEMESIGELAFGGCKNLKKTYYKGTIDQWVGIVFGWAGNPLYNSGCVLYIDDKPVINAEITTATEIKDYAFNGFSSLKSITIPNGVTSIGDNAFDGCKSLTAITIPDSVTDIGSGAFSFCSSLSDVSLPNSINTIEQGTFAQCKSLVNITIPSSVTSIGYGAFTSCIMLKEVAIPNGVTSIGDTAFHWCTSLEKIIIPSSVTSIGNNVFYNCGDLVIYGDGDSYAQQYAENNGLKFVLLDVPNNPTNSVLGDIDGDKKVSVMDATIIQMYFAELVELNENQILVADTDKDGTFSVLDATRIQMYLAKLIEEF